MPQRDVGKQTGIRQKRDHPAEAESRPFNKREALGIANQRGRDGLQMLRGYVFHPRKVRNPQAVLVREVTPEAFRVNLDRTQSAEPTKTQKAAEGTSRQRYSDR